MTTDPSDVPEIGDWSRLLDGKVAVVTGGAVPGIGHVQLRHRPQHPRRRRDQGRRRLVLQPDRQAVHKPPDHALISRPAARWARLCTNRRSRQTTRSANRSRFRSRSTFQDPGRATDPSRTRYVRVGRRGEPSASGSPVHGGTPHRQAQRSTMTIAALPLARANNTSQSLTVRGASRLGAARRRTCAPAFRLGHPPSPLRGGEEGLSLGDVSSGDRH